MLTEADVIQWPQKKGELNVAALDSRQWNGFAFRPDDVVIATYAKSGTTLTQQIVAQLVFDADPVINGHAVSPWIDLPTPPFVKEIASATGALLPLQQAASQTHRRFLKTHLPVENLVYSPAAKYIFIGRDIRDLIWSFHNHTHNSNPPPPGMPPPKDGEPVPPPPPNPDIRKFYHDVLDGRWEFQPLWSYFRSWWAIRDLPNLMMIHYADMIADPPGAIRKIAAFLDIPVDDARLSVMARHCSIEHMRSVAADDMFLNFMFREGSKTFMNKGTNGRWRDVLAADEIAKCDRLAAQHLEPECAAWLRSAP